MSGQEVADDSSGPRKFDPCTNRYRGHTGQSARSDRGGRRNHHSHRLAQHPFLVTPVSKCLFIQLYGGYTNLLIIVPTSQGTSSMFGTSRTPPVLIPRRPGQGILPSTLDLTQSQPMPAHEEIAADHLLASKMAHLHLVPITGGHSSSTSPQTR